jgi:16S rRNA (uracil1498-N3)-methyltransferase
VTRRRWIADHTSGNHAALVGEHARHLASVLRARVGQEFDIATGDRVRRGKITHVGDDRVEFELGEDVPAPPAADITIVLAIFKFDRLEWAIEKLTELGIARIVPLIAKRTEAHLAKAAVKRAERWRRIAHEAAQQSRRTAPPEIGPPTKLKNALELPGKRLVLSEFGGEPLFSASPGSGPLVLAIGPEGGWTEDELRAFEQAGWTAASLGPTILRAETAAIAAAAVALSARE